LSDFLLELKESLLNGRFGGLVNRVVWHSLVV